MSCHFLCQLWVSSSEKELKIAFGIFMYCSPSLVNDPFYAAEFLSPPWRSTQVYLWLHSLFAWCLMYLLFALTGQAFYNVHHPNRRRSFSWWRCRVLLICWWSQFAQLCCVSLLANPFTVCRIYFAMFRLHVWMDHVWHCPGGLLIMYASNCHLSFFFCESRTDSLALWL